MDLQDLIRSADEARRQIKPSDIEYLQKMSQKLQSDFSYQDSLKSLFERVSEVSQLSDKYYDILSGIGENNRYSNLEWFFQSDTSYSRQRELEKSLQDVILELRSKTKEIETSTSDRQQKEVQIAELKIKISEFEKKKLLSHLLIRVNEAAQKKLIEDEVFSSKFAFGNVCKSVVVSIDIRNSTQLMLNAKKPELFANFITSISKKLFNIVTSNFGVYDKFTGDGLLCFFPDFFSGKDAMYYALKTAVEAHLLFELEYRKCYSSFLVVRADVGLGIGIDYGNVCLTSINNDFTIVGIPVVYACRLSSAPAYHTYLNQPALELVKLLYHPYYKETIQLIDFKHQGSMIAYEVDFNFGAKEAKIPNWS